jgi:hypothetical protein
MEAGKGPPARNLVRRLHFSPSAIDGFFRSGRGTVMWTRSLAVSCGLFLAAVVFLSTPAPGYSLGVGKDVNGYPQLFALGLDDSIYLGMYLNNAWRPWTLTENFKVKDFSVINDRRGFPEIYAIDRDSHQVFMMHFDGQAHWARIPLPGEFFARAISVVQDEQGRPDLFVIGRDRRIFERRLYPGRRWGPWQVIAPEQVKAISVTANNKGVPQVFMLGQDNMMHQTTPNRAAGTWNGWVTVGAPSQVKRISASTDANGFPVAYAVGMDDQIWMDTLNDDGTWGQWSLVGGMKVKEVHSSKDPQGGPRLLAVGQDDRVYMLGVDAQGNWGDWQATEDGPVKK